MTAGFTDASLAEGALAYLHGRHLLQLLGLDQEISPPTIHPALAWRRAGLCAVTGRAYGPGLVCPVPLGAVADGALAALQAITPSAQLPKNGAALLGERARMMGFSRQGAISANGSCRLLACDDGHVALNLPRVDDWELVPALFEATVSDWSDVARLARDQSADQLVERGVLLGLAIAADHAVEPPTSPFSIEQLGVLRATPDRQPLVVDLSALWAGPLAGSLLRMAGAKVIKVESLARPEGARQSSPSFFALLNDGKEHRVLDFSKASDLVHLRELAASADIVIEGSRPRALQQMGIDAREIAANGATWLSISAHGRDERSAMRIGFGDDAAVAGGLSYEMRLSWGEPLFAGDAIADPLTGITAALAGWAGWLHGGGQMITISLTDTVANARKLYVADPDILQSWQRLARADQSPVFPLRVLN